METARFIARTLPATFVLLCCSATLSHAAWPHDAVNGNLAICTATSAQNNPWIISDGAGGAIMVWEDFRSGANVDIYAQRVNAAGVAQWTTNGVAVCTAVVDQVAPAIVSDGFGGAFITWSDSRNGVNYDVYAQHVQSNGTALWTSNGVLVCTVVTDRYGPMPISDGAGGAIITWYDRRNGNWDIFAQRLDPMGNRSWGGSGVGLCTDLSDQYSAAIVTDGAGGAIVSWQDWRSGTYDIYAQRVNGSGTPQWTANGVAINVAPNDQTGPVMVSDGAGGMIVAWQDQSSGNYDVYAQRLNGSGTALWSFGGVGICYASADQYGPVIATDGAGGAIVAWYDFRGGGPSDIYAQRVSATGMVQWLTNGVAVSLASGGQYTPTIASDNTGGAILSWTDARNGANDIYAQRVNAVGNVQWTTNGVALSTAGGSQNTPRIAWDGGQGAVVVWQDARYGANDIYAQRIERFGQLGNPEPSIVKIKDTPGDQGGKLGIQWTASYLDVAPGNPIDSYWIWRQVPTASASIAIERDASSFAEAPGGTPRPGALRTTVEGAQIYYWEFVGSQVAHGFAGYSYTASTLSDSIGAGNPYTRFMVEAEQSSAGYYWGSAPDSGYSVDNLPPVAPAPFAGTYGAGTTQLHWRANTEGDLANYRLYRGSSSSFTPSLANRVAEPSDTAYTDPAGAPYYYKLSAVDVHGNESGFTTLLPGGTVDVPGDRSLTQLALGFPQPNPARGRAVFHFSLPREGRVQLALFDQQGRRVRDLLVGLMPAGEHTASWDGRDQSGRLVPSGVYFCRLEADGRTLSRRFATIR